MLIDINQKAQWSIVSLWALWSVSLLKMFSWSDGITNVLCSKKEKYELVLQQFRSYLTIPKPANDFFSPITRSLLSSKEIENSSNPSSLAADEEQHFPTRSRFFNPWTRFQIFFCYSRSILNISFFQKYKQITAWYEIIDYNWYEKFRPF